MNDRESTQRDQQAPQDCHLSALAEFVARIVAPLWQQLPDPRSVIAGMGRYSAHAGILVVALLIGVLSRFAFAPTGLTEGSAAPMLATVEPVVSVEQVVNAIGYFASEPRLKVIPRQANPLTTIPERERLDVITYTVEPGDTVFDIALAFKLDPTTIVWSNMETLQGAPWLLQPGVSLVILPVDGAYHTVRDDETAETIATDYKVETTALYNAWNDIEPNRPLTVGTLLVIPGGTGGDFDWEPPPPPVVAGSSEIAPSWTYTGEPVVYAARGTFALPTGSYAVSGWTFHDPRNPYHGGLDYRCRLGDPIYAADAGQVVYAGWGGGYGNLVQVDHGNGFVTYYAHFSAFAVGNGQPVAQGQIVGYCGSTGYSSGPHLHYEIRYNGVQQDPKLYEP